MTERDISASQRDKHPSKNNMEPYTAHYVINGSEVKEVSLSIHADHNSSVTT